VASGGVLCGSGRRGRGRGRARARSKLALGLGIRPGERKLGLRRWRLCLVAATAAALWRQPAAVSCAGRSSLRARSSWARRVAVAAAARVREAPAFGHVLGAAWAGAFQMLAREAPAGGRWAPAAPGGSLVGRRASGEAARPVRLARRGRGARRGAARWRLGAALRSATLPRRSVARLQLRGREASRRRSTIFQRRGGSRRRGAASWLALARRRGSGARRACCAAYDGVPAQSRGGAVVRGRRGGGKQRTGAVSYVGRSECSSRDLFCSLDFSLVPLLTHTNSSTKGALTGVTVRPVLTVGPGRGAVAPSTGGAASPAGSRASRRRRSA
jgi:hypothetical protein